MRVKNHSNIVKYSPMLKNRQLINTIQYNTIQYNTILATVFAPIQQVIEYYTLIYSYLIHYNVRPNWSGSQGFPWQKIKEPLTQDNS